VHGAAKGLRTGDAHGEGMTGRRRDAIRPGLRVAIVLKQDQRTGRTVEGIVAGVLTRSATHPHGIKVRLTDGRVGRVVRLIGDGGTVGRSRTVPDQDRKTLPHDAGLQKRGAGD